MKLQEFRAYRPPLVERLRSACAAPDVAPPLSGPRARASCWRAPAAAPARVRAARLGTRGKPACFRHDQHVAADGGYCKRGDFGCSVPESCLFLAPGGAPGAGGGGEGPRGAEPRGWRTERFRAHDAQSTLVRRASAIGDPVTRTACAERPSTCGKPACVSGAGRVALGGAPGAGGRGEERARLSHTSEPTRSSARRTRARIACGTGTKECRFLASGGPRCAERTGVVPRAEMRRWFATAA
jgi:hypothetical protein